MSLESLGQSLLQGYVFLRIFVFGAEAGGVGVNFSTNLLLQSISISLFSLGLAAFKVHRNSRGMQVSVLDYLKQQVQMGKGIPYDALKSNKLYHLDLSEQALTPKQADVLGHAMRDNLSVETAKFQDGGEFDEAAVKELRSGATIRLSDVKAPGPVSHAFVASLLADNHLYNPSFTSLTLSNIKQIDIANLSEDVDLSGCLNSVDFCVIAILLMDKASCTRLNISGNRLVPDAIPIVVGLMQMGSLRQVCV